MMIDFRMKIYMCFAITAVVFLPVLVSVIWNKKRTARRLLERDKYWMRLSPMCFITGIIGTLFFYIITITIVFALDADAVMVAIFLCVTFFYEYFVFISLFWEIKVEADALTIYRPPLPSKYIKFYEITTVKYIENRLMGHIGGKTQLIFFHNEKKLFDVGDSMSGFYQLLETFAGKANFFDKGDSRDDVYQRLENFSGKIKLERGYLKEGGIELNELKEEFSVMETGANKVRAAVLPVISGGVFIATVINWEEMLEEMLDDYLFFGAVCFLFALMIMWLVDFLNAMLRKVTVTYRIISIRNSIGRVKTYSVEEITKVVEKEHFIMLFRGNKKIAKISKDDKNFALLEEWLKRFL